MQKKKPPFSGEAFFVWGSVFSLLVNVLVMISFYASVPVVYYAGSGLCDRFCSKISVLTGLPMMP
jgi:hypothetical protein